MTISYVLSEVSIPGIVEDSMRLYRCTEKLRLSIPHSLVPGREMPERQPMFGVLTGLMCYPAKWRVNVLTNLPAML